MDECVHQGEFTKNQIGTNKIVHLNEGIRVEK